MDQKKLFKQLNDTNLEDSIELKNIYKKIKRFKI